jgi:hypothetical protein
VKSPRDAWGTLAITKIGHMFIQLFILYFVSMDSIPNSVNKWLYRNIYHTGQNESSGKVKIQLRYVRFKCFLLIFDQLSWFAVGVDKNRLTRNFRLDQSVTIQHTVYASYIQPPKPFQQTQIQRYNSYSYNTYNQNHESLLQRWNWLVVLRESNSGCSGMLFKDQPISTKRCFTIFAVLPCVSIGVNFLIHIGTPGKDNTD